MEIENEYEEENESYSTRLTILKPDEIKLIYDIPMFSNEERETYFDLSQPVMMCSQITMSATRRLLICFPSEVVIPLLSPSRNFRFSRKSACNAVQYSLGDDFEIP